MSHDILCELSPFSTSCQCGSRAYAADPLEGEPAPVARLWAGYPPMVEATS